MFWLAGGYRSSGQQHIPAKGPCLIASNHLSFADPAALCVGSPRPGFYMAQEELFRIPILGWMIRFCQAYPVKAKGMDREALRRSLATLQQHGTLCVFAEGGIAQSGHLEPLRQGVALLALRTGATVVPAAISGTQRVLPYPSRRPRFAPGGVRVCFGPPLDLSRMPEELSRHEQEQWLTSQLHEAIAKLLPPELQPVEQPDDAEC